MKFDNPLEYFDNFANLYIGLFKNSTNKKELIIPKSVHITPSGTSSWAVRVDPSLRARKILSTQKQAVEFVKPLQMKGFDVVVHNKTGMVDYIIDSNGRKY